MTQFLLNARYSLIKKSSGVTYAANQSLYILFTINGPLHM